MIDSMQPIEMPMIRWHGGRTCAGSLCLSD
jgi:hypothetical protein